MAKTPNRRMTRADLDVVRNAATALPDIPAYQPLNRAFSTEQVSTLLATMQAAQQNEQRALRAINAARDAAEAAEWELYQAIVGVRRQVVAQFGDDSDEIRALGLKKRSDYKRPARMLRENDVSLV